MKTVIEMAREADKPDETCWLAYEIDFLERFAELVRAEERKAMMQLFIDPENQPTQHGTVTVQYMQREIAAEREACAKVCADLWCKEPEPGDARDCYDAIRARGQA